MNSSRLKKIVFLEYDNQALVTARETRGLTLRAVASELGVSYTHLCNVENGSLTPTAEFVEKLCAFYGLEPTTIIREETKPAKIFA